jgi:asparagine synthase (glutamine-hydrolysing)
MSRLWPKADWLPRYLRMKTTLTNLSLDADQAYANTISITRQPMRRRLLHPDVRAQLNGHCPEDRVTVPFERGNGDALGGMIASDVAMLLPDDFLTKVDRASMAVGLEVRPPMVDHEFLELCARVPAALKVRNGQTKWLFKKMCDGWLPDAVVHRPKKGFEIPVDDWLRGPLRDLFEGMVFSQGNASNHFLDTSTVRRLLRRHLTKQANYGQTLWAILIFASWSERWLRVPAIR